MAMQLVPHDINIDFISRTRWAAIASTIAVVASLLLMVFVGPTWGIDFTGGTEVRLKFAEETEIGELRDALGALQLGPDAVQQYGAQTDNEFVIRVQGTTAGTEELEQSVTSGLQQRFGADWIAESDFDAQVGARMTVRYNGDAVPLSDIEAAVAGVEGVRVRPATDENTVYIELPGLTATIEESIKAELAGRQFEVRNVDSVGPKVGEELKYQGITAMAATLALMLLYIGFRFDATFAPGAILALFHDVTITVGVFILFDAIGWVHEFNLSMVGALLTIIGTSINDTIVTYDRIRENKKRYRRRDTVGLVNTSINETLGRTLATNLTTGLALTAFLVLGGEVIQTFALAMMVGLVVGTYSTIFIASPSILMLEKFRPAFDRLLSPAGARAEAAAAAAGGVTSSGAQTASERRRMEREARRRGEQQEEET